MAPVLGKRKARPVDREPATEPEDAQAIFRRHFEAQFKPLPVAAKPVLAAGSEDETDSDGEDSEWDGISDEDDDGEMFSSPF